VPAVAEVPDVPKVPKCAGGEEPYRRISPLEAKGGRDSGAVKRRAACRYVCYDHLPLAVSGRSYASLHWRIVSLCAFPPG
jgi:hypothetical protein